MNNFIWFSNLFTGKLRLSFNFGSNVTEIIIVNQNNLNDGNWHQVDIHFDTTQVHLILDTCAHSTRRRFGEVEVMLNKCQNRTTISSHHQLLNVNAPLQIGGVSTNTQQALQEQHNISFHNRPFVGFTGCLRNFVVNGHIYDLVEVHHSRHSHVGCYSSKAITNRI